MTNAVLVFDESPVVRELCAVILESCGFKVDSIGDSREAIVAAAQQEYSFMIVGNHKDDNAPISVSLLRAVEQTCGRYTPIIAISETLDRKSCAAAGMDDCISMPLSSNNLRRAIERWYHYTVGRSTNIAS